MEKFESLLRDLVSSSMRTELYMNGIFSIELARLNILSPDQLLDVITTIHKSIEMSITMQEERRKAEHKWPVKNLAA